MKIKKLHDLNILVTRPYPSGAKLCELIKSQGGCAIHLPTLAFAPPKNSSKFIASIRKLSQQNWLIFISPQAVYASLPVLRQEWRALLPSIKLACIGIGTMKALHQAGYLHVLYPKKKWNSEGLLALPEFQSLNKQKIAIIRGEKGRDQLEQTLKKRGARVLPIIAYRRIIPEIEIHPYQMLLKQQTIDSIIATSNNGIVNLTKMMGKALHTRLLDIPLVVISERIKELAHHLGFQTIWVAHNASHEAILELLAKKRNELCQMKMKL
ncbi:MAG: hypothetical protein A3F42_03195 [Gammaproteobacteria bacterium RIFCSPHIGHO2_12_FULL_37_34]|nr:MAG: hypothetical protein A3F42_03195 [Gammaproteobacteria bacterium RIFCSPHIGHO2_12_FULL_37_34]